MKDKTAPDSETIESHRTISKGETIKPNRTSSNQNYLLKEKITNGLNQL